MTSDSSAPVVVPLGRFLFPTPALPFAPSRIRYRELLPAAAPHPRLSSSNRSAWAVPHYPLYIPSNVRSIVPASRRLLDKALLNRTCIDVFSTSPTAEGTRRAHKDRCAPGPGSLLPPLRVHYVAKRAVDSNMPGL